MMEINADFGRRAAVHAAHLAWVPSPIEGVERKMLDRIGDEVARATSIVRYAPGSHFSAHTHGGGEEFLVLEGVFQDEYGDFPAGSYVRNPPQSRHTPGSSAGCTIFVKLWQFDPGDRRQVRLDAYAAEPKPVAGRSGVEAAEIFGDDRETVRIERWAPGTRISAMPVGGLEVFCVDGGFVESGEHFEQHSWLRLPAGAGFEATAGPAGCRAWVKEGHLRFANTDRPPS